MRHVSPQIEIIAHRGASADAPENTLESLELAIQQGADWVECDVRRSHDGVLFIHHDPNRGTNLLRRMDFLAIKAMPGGGSIPTLDELLSLGKGRIKYDIELKEGGYEAEVLDLIKHHLKLQDVLITSFEDDVLAELKRLEPNIQTGLLVGHNLTDQDPARQWRDFFPHKRVKKIGATYVVSHYLLGDIVSRWWLRRLGIPVILWTVDQPRQIERYFKDPNVRAIITNRPGMVVAMREGIGKPPENDR